MNLVLAPVCFCKRTSYLYDGMFLNEKFSQMNLLFEAPLPLVGHFIFLNEPRVEAHTAFGAIHRDY